MKGEVQRSRGRFMDLKGRLLRSSPAVGGQIMMSKLAGCSAVDNEHYYDE